VKNWQQEIRHCKLNVKRQKYYKQKKIANVDCKQFDDTVGQIITACTVLAKGRYIQRHDTVCAELPCNMSYRHVQNWQKDGTYRDMTQGVLNCTVTCHIGMYSTGKRTVHTET